MSTLGLMTWKKSPISPVRRWPDGCHHLGHVCAAPRHADCACQRADGKSMLRKRRRNHKNPQGPQAQGRRFAIRPGFSSTGQGRRPPATIWKGVEGSLTMQGLRGATLGGAQMSPKHPKLLINTGFRDGGRPGGIRRVGAKKGFTYFFPAGLR